MFLAVMLLMLQERGREGRQEGGRKGGREGGRKEGRSEGVRGRGRKGESEGGEDVHVMDITQIKDAHVGERVGEVGDTKWGGGG